MEDSFGNRLENLQQDQTTVSDSESSDSECQSKARSGEATERVTGKKDHRTFARTSKHAPTETSSKKAASRRREVISTSKPSLRDPRFDAVRGAPNAEKVRQNYAFLNEYQDAEIKDLKAVAKKSKNAIDQDEAKRNLKALESRRRARELREQRQDTIRQHRAQEKIKIKEGKKPFHLKSRAVKELMLQERFKGMKKSEIDDAIARRRQKQSSKKRQSMPDGRRT